MDLVARIREFNRRWTALLGLLDRGMLQTDLSLSEARVLFELGRGLDRAALIETLGMDPSYLTRVAAALEERGLVAVSRSEADRRKVALELTGAGALALRELDARSSAQIHGMFENLSPDERRRAAESAALLLRIIDPAAPVGQATLRGLGPGDLGWVVMRHGEIYADEYGWDRDFEGLVAKIVADFHANARPGRDRAWVAEVDGVRAGCVFCVEHDASTAQLRILLVEPWARGHGLGRQLVDACVDFARAAGYATIRLWTNDVLVSARRIYEATGFVLVAHERHRSFGQELTAQVWERALAP